ncbi:MAG: hypothetical protein HYY56_05185 [Candidatus Omnitrophica bacterium]|nr:hypothetical protein [Candidatus Omnitrophota bacterium]
MNYIAAAFDAGATTTRIVAREHRFGDVIKPEQLVSFSTKTKHRTNEYGLLCEEADKALCRLLNELPMSIRRKVKVITVTSHGASEIALDAKGEAVFGIYCYDTEIKDDDRLRFYREFGSSDELFVETGTPEFPKGINSLQSVYYIKRRFPREFKKVKTLVPLSSYIAYLLTGRLFTDSTHTRNHGYIETVARRGFSSVVYKMGIEKLFPGFKRSFDTYGLISEKIADKYGLPKDCIVVSCGHDSSVTAVLAENMISTGTWIVNLSDGREILLKPPLQRKGLLVNADIFGENLRTMIARLGQMRQRLIDRYKEQFGEDVPLDMPFESSEDMAAGDIIIPSDMEGVGPYPSTLEEVRIPVSLRNPSRFHHELAFSIAVQEALSSIMASDPGLNSDGTLGQLLKRGYRAAPVVIGGPFAGNYRTQKGEDSGRPCIFMEFFRRVYPGEVKRLLLNEPTSFSSDILGVSAFEGTDPRDIRDRIKIPAEDVTWRGDRKDLLNSILAWEKKIKKG